MQYTTTRNTTHIFAYTEIHQVRGISGSSTKIELPCLVDQQNCGEVYYITWTRQSLSGFQNTSSISSSSSLNLQQQQQQQLSQQHSPLSLSSSQSSILLNNPNHHQQQWTRVYLYTGSNDSLPHKPIGDLVNRATFIMPERQQTNSNDNNNNDNDTNEDVDGQIKTNQPMAKLVIEEPKISDEALYKCDVTYVKGKCPSISLVKVQMLALPEKAQIISSNNNHLHTSSSSPVPASGEIIPEGHLVGPYNEHEQLKLTCLVYGGRPQPKAVIWRKIDTSGRTTNLMPLKFSPSQQQSTVSTSFYSTTTTTHKQHQSVVQVDLNHTLTSADLGAKFECHVEHEAIEQQPTARVVSSANNGISEQVATQTATSQSAQHNNRQMLHDSMLDLHPSQSQSESSSGLLSDEISSEASSYSSPPTTVLLSQANSRSKSLDSHVFVDLNGKLYSLNLVLVLLACL